MSKLTVLYALFSAVLYVVLVRRHTRVEEETGRAELAAGTVIGRDCSAGCGRRRVWRGRDDALDSWSSVADVAGGLPVAGSLFFGVAWLGTGLVATGIAAVACQLSASSRTCASIAAGLLAGAFAVRAVGDSVGPLGWLSWLSPLGWNTQLRAWSDPRWWVAGTVRRARCWPGRRRPGDAQPARHRSRSDRRPTRSRRGTDQWAMVPRPSPPPHVARPVDPGCRGHGGALRGHGARVRRSAQQRRRPRAGRPDGRHLHRCTDARDGSIVVTCFPIAVIGAAHQDEEVGRTGLALSTATSRARWFGATGAVAWGAAPGCCSSPGLPCGWGTEPPVE